MKTVTRKFLYLLIFGCTLSCENKKPIDSEGIFGNKPQVSAFSTSRPPEGGMLVNIMGSGFEVGATVQIKLNDCNSVEVESPEYLHCKLPSIMEFVLSDILVTNPNGLSNDPLVGETSSVNSALPPFSSGSWADSFDSGLNTEYWTVNNDVSAVGGRVFVNHTPAPMMSGMDSKFLLTGDFNVSVSYSSLSFSSCFFSAVGMSTTLGPPGFYNIERRINSSVEQMLTDMAGGQFILNSSTSGIFRIRRIGSTISVYQPDGLTVLYSGSGSIDPMKVRLYGRDDGYGCTASGYFDNFQVQ